MPQRGRGREFTRLRPSLPFGRLRAAGGHVEPYIPNRFEEGYGLNIEALRTLAEKGIRLVVTVDCGARSPANRADCRGGFAT